MRDTLSTPVGESVSYLCAWCGEPGELVVDLSGGRRQRLVEDCWVCCRPNLLDLSVGADGGATVSAGRES